MHKGLYLLPFIISVLILMAVVGDSISKDLKHTDNKRISQLERKCALLARENIRLLSEIGKDTKVYARITFYHPGSGGINTDGDVNNTATMTKPIPGKTCAISTELVRMGWLSKKIYIEGYGVFEADDRMARGLTGKRIDLCVGSLKDIGKNGKNIFCCIISK